MRLISYLLLLLSTGILTTVFITVAYAGLLFLLFSI